MTFKERLSGFSEMQRGVLARLVDMRDAIRWIQRQTEHVGRAEFERNVPLRAAVERWLEIISEASRHVPDTAKARHPQIEWRKIAGIGNVLRHDYQNVAPGIIWDTIQLDLDALRAVVDDLIANEQT